MLHMYPILYDILSEFGGIKDINLSIYGPL